jgi:predicted  nucleic acid-binding Zn-ribbon protein
LNFGTFPHATFHNKYFFQASSATQETSQSEETVDQLRTQLTTLMNSLATLSAEKSRMEASFQADKKQLRSEREEVLLKHLKPELLKRFLITGSGQHGLLFQI